MQHCKSSNITIVESFIEIPQLLTSPSPGIECYLVD